ncbi:SAM-dependent methyltransferase [Alteribacter lacisalsi]|uniref:SAM-dependent methyltransferase n=1 Tax=Alteribacter lacisalsi TaxID=2045244 RepID=A0A2W0HFD6_9BACI|nr:class I SAM-dependent methyltransferase [Alteribacter lacisalsi]PYZ95519.1 SAM-dependent methyltransferase [Alteribacter lacisalsi]
MRHYEQLLESYNNHAGDREKMTLTGWKENERIRFLERLNKGARLLDLGAGTGEHGAFFLRNGVDVTCGDFSPAMVSACRKKWLKAEVVDFYSLKTDRPFDAVWSMNALLHVPKADLGLALENIRGVLVSDGLFYLGLYGGEDSEGVWDSDPYEPKRFFSFHTETGIREAVQPYFDVLEYRYTALEKGPDYHALMLRKREES